MIDKPALDRWSLIHVVAGLALAQLKVPPALAIGGIVAYELVEPYVWPGWRETRRNRVADAALAIAAYGITRR
jgi:hypothetical protein